jgi:hypothetical protein
MAPAAHLQHRVVADAVVSFVRSLCQPGVEVGCIVSRLAVAIRRHEKDDGLLLGEPRLPAVRLDVLRHKLGAVAIPQQQSRPAGRLTAQVGGRLGMHAVPDMRAVLQARM